MIETSLQIRRPDYVSYLVCVCAATLLSACGGSQDGADGATRAGALRATGTTTMRLSTAPLPAAAAAQLAQPGFHTAPLLLNAPDDTDAANANGSAHLAPHTQRAAAGYADLPTRGLTVQAIQARRRALALRGPSAAATPPAVGPLYTVYTPAQIRAAYFLAPLPAPGAALSDAQAALLGAGQTIYIVDAMHDPNAQAELNAFNQKFGLPACTAAAIATGASLPLAAPTGSCTFSVVYSGPDNTMTGAAPAYDAGWAGEIALDVQWAHAIAPLARIVLVEAPDASTSSLLDGVRLANAMGPGVVSMSWGLGEGDWTPSVEAAFSAPGMSYAAGTGDSGAGTFWPAVSPHVLAVGGTSLNYSGSGARSETTWSGTGGGVSPYLATPSYQQVAVPGLAVATHRSMADVAFNADPGTGQYTAVMTPGSGDVSWISSGGTSLATPQWAGILAIANATRALTAQAPLGTPHTLLYAGIASVPGNYASAFADVVSGGNGGCATCVAGVGYDTPTGLGTPNVSNVLDLLTGNLVAATPPQVSSASVAGITGTALTFTVATTAANPVAYTLGGAPAGMAIAASGAVTWPAPVAGSYAVTVSARDTVTGLSGQGQYSVTVTAPPPPVLTPNSVTGKVGVALSFAVTVNAPHPVTYALGGAPAGMAIDAAGTVTWAAPQLGGYTVAVIATDSTTGLSGQGDYVVTITPVGPILTASGMNGVAGQPLTGAIQIDDHDAWPQWISIAGLPMGMTFSISGLTVITSWPNPVAGSYNLDVTVGDAAGITTRLQVPFTVSAP